ncbi:MAG: ribosome-associated translation inhibitor RaiA [Rhodospirillaceae bacterium]|jgi:ribosomal subunit interface protein|nr:ribosome-associated translation inhibitor RaiA [Rhodospirillaceae bacterium]
MDISVKGKNLDVGDSLRVHATDNLTSVVGKYFNHAIDASVIFSREGSDLKADISVHPGPRGLVVQSASAGIDAYGAFDGALERVATQLRRYKRRLSNHHQKARDDEELLSAQYAVIQPETTEDEPHEDQPPMIIAEMETEIVTLSVGEAVMRMDLADAPVIMFRNSVSGGLNVVYRRADGNIGWIDPANVGS